MKTNRSVFCLTVLLLCSVLAAATFPQAQSANAHLTGIVTDPSGAAIAGVRITVLLEGVSNNRLSSTTSSSDGSFSLSIPSGRYQIHFSSDSFTTRTVPVALQPSESRSLPVRMELATLLADG